MEGFEEWKRSYDRRMNIATAWGLLIGAVLGALPIIAHVIIDYLYGS